MSIDKIIRKFSRCPNSSNMDKIIDWAKSDNVDDEEIILLAKTLAYSGKTLSFPEEVITVDIPSTGGPTSLSTIICPLILKDLGFTVPKLGVPGRPAGGVDILAQIPGYKVKLGYTEILNCINRFSYCHFLANDEFAPLDLTLFSYRSKKNAKSLPPLVMASILSKKIAVGLKIIGLDVRVAGYGNFGKDWLESKNNSQKFIRIAKKLGFKTWCFLNDISKIQQPFIGRGEALIGVFKLANMEYDYLLNRHLDRCINMCYTISSACNASNISNIVYLGLKENLKAQGSSENALYKKVKEIQNNHRFELIADKSGFLNLNIEKLRDSIVFGQNSSSDTLFPDLCGVIFSKYSKDFVEKGETILTYRVSNNIKEKFLDKLRSSIEICTNYDSDFDYELIS